ncbi:MAG: hypothetical protein GTN71_16870, partial [Anaerolineae bacterium]|nr:hypothetical protein [Anaerolineae bacterium]
AKTPEPVVPSEPSGPKGATLNLVGSDPPTLDPHLSMDATSAAYIIEIFSGLVTLSPELEVVPDIAERWEVSEDGTVYTFYLRDDAKFHDGKPVTARDFKYSFERACDPWTGSVVADIYLGDIVGAKEKLYGFVDEVSGVEVVDDHTLQITIDAPKPYFLGKLTHSTAFVVDKDNVERGGRTWTDKPNGTGPFKLKEYRFGRQIVLEPNDLYYGEPKPSVEAGELYPGRWLGHDHVRERRTGGCARGPDRHRAGHRSDQPPQQGTDHCSHHEHFLPRFQRQPAAL